MKFLVDANVLSEATKPAPNSMVLNWLSKNERVLAINPIVLGELEYGIFLLPPGKKRERLLKWLTSGIQHLEMLVLDTESAREWAQLLSELKRKGHAMPIKDSLIAASARQHGFTIATRNTKDFAPAGVKLVNPFE